MKEKILEKIRKLFAAAESEKKIGNTEAAELLAEKARELLDKYNLSLSEAEIEAEMREEIGFEIVNRVGFLKVERWHRHLLKIFADLSGCLSIDNGFQLGLVGRPQDRAVAIEFYRYFEKLANEFADRESESFRQTIRFQMLGGLSALETHRNSYLFGFACRLGDRLREKEAIEETVTQNLPSQALVLVRDKADEARAWAYKYMDVGVCPHPEIERFDESAFHQGAAVGDQVALTNKTIK